MIGNVVYIIVCQYVPERSRQIETIHATYDGAYNQMKKRAEEWEKFGYFPESDGAYMEVRDKVGQLLYIYYVSTKTIER